MDREICYKTTKGNRGVIRPEGRNSFIILSSFCKVKLEGPVSLTSFEVGFGSGKHAATWYRRKESRRGTVSEHNLWLTPVDMWVMLSEPGVSEDNVVMSRSDT